jgi:hypothetical protein
MNLAVASLHYAELILEGLRLRCFAKATAHHQLQLRPLSECGLNLRRTIGLGKKPATLRKVGLFRVLPPRGDNDLDRRPSIAHGTSKFQPVNGPRHMNVGEYHADVVATLENFDCCVGIRGLNDLETFIFSDLHGAQADGGSSSTIKITGLALPVLRHTLNPRILL